MARFGPTTSIDDSTVDDMEWFEACEWNEQDARRTLEHLDEHIDHDRNPGQSRWYAAVVRPGRIAVGDVVTASPSL